MGIKFGEIDADQILDNEFRIMVLERVIDKLITANPSVANALNVKSIREEVIEVLKTKYPNSGIDFKE